MGMPYRYVPSSVPEVREQICAMVIAIPDLVDNIADGGVPGAFRDLQDGLNLIRKRLGEKLYLQLSEMAEASHAHFKAGEDRQGRFILQDMDEAMRQRPKAN